MSEASHKATGDAALAVTISPGLQYHFDEARLTLNSASATVEDFTIRLDSTYGSTYDVLLCKEDMNGVRDLHVVNTEETRYLKGDSLIFSWANTDSILWGMEVRYLTR